VLSLSPGPTALADAAEVGSLAQMWRISDDFWDYWASPTANEYPQGVLGQFDKTAAWERYAKPGNWPDADMLPLGHLGPYPGEGVARNTRLTPDEQRTVITLWSIARSPLILGANLTQLDPFTASLLTNPEVIAVDQHSTGNRMAGKDGNIIAWTAHSPAHNSEYLALFNTGGTPARIGAPFTKYGLAEKNYSVHDLWQKKNLGKATHVSATIPPHGTVLLELR
jgi:hypothetical protein